MTLNFATTIGDNTDATVGASCGTGTIYTAISQSGAMTLSIGTGAVTLISTTIALIGNVTIAAGKDLHKNVAGPFASGTGAVSLICATVALNSNVTIAADRTGTRMLRVPSLRALVQSRSLKHSRAQRRCHHCREQGLAQDVAGPFASGTGAVSLIGAYSPASTKRGGISTVRPDLKTIRGRFAASTSQDERWVTPFSHKGGVPSSAFTGQACPRG